MPCQLIWEPRGVVKRHYGFLTGEELLAAAESVAGSERYDQLSYIINVFLEVDGHSISAADIEAFAALRIGAGMVRRTILSPFVVIAEPGLSITHKLISPAYANTHPVNVFETLDACRQWLEVALPPATTKRRDQLR